MPEFHQQNMAYYLIEAGRGGVLDLRSLNTQIFAATDCIDDVAVFVPLSSTHVFAANVRAATRPDGDNEVVQLKNPIDLTKQWLDDPSQNPIPKSDSTKWRCTPQQGLKLQTAVKDRVRNVILNHFPAGLDVLEKQNPIQFSALACSRLVMSFGYSKTSDYIFETLREMLGYDISKCISCFGFVARPDAPPVPHRAGPTMQWLQQNGCNKLSTHAILHTDDFSFIWHEEKEEWVLRTEYEQN